MVGGMRIASINTEGPPKKEDESRARQLISGMNKHLASIRESTANKVNRNVGPL